MTMMPLPSAVPNSFRDPLYETLARQAEERFGLPTGILDAIRTRGERSNANQVSPAGARTVYQFIPSTRRGMIKNYGIDPWKGPQEATEAAAQLLKENYKRTGSWNSSVAQYHGGLDKRNHGPRTRAYKDRVGDFDQEVNMAQSPYYQNIVPSGAHTPPSWVSPLQLPPERPTEAAPVTVDAGPSVSVPATDPRAAKRHGGILGAMESIFMPSPDTLWGQALTGQGGLFHARANLEAHQRGKAKEQIDIDTANAKLKNLLTKGEYQVVGNNVFHIKPDGSHEMISPPTTSTENERLIDQWKTMDDSDPAKELIYRILLGANNPEVLAAKQRQAMDVARVRAGATTESARIRSTQPSITIPENWTVVK